MTTATTTMKPTTAMESATSVKPAAKAGSAAIGEGTGVAAMVESAECAGVHAATMTE